MKVPPLRSIPGTAKKLAMARVAPNFDYAETVVQLFLHRTNIHTTYTFTNISSLYCPQSASACRYELTLHDAQGARVGRTEVEVPAFGTAEVRLHERLDGPMPNQGLVVTRIRNAPRRNPGADHLGNIKPHFYALYHAPDMGSVALIHPQTGLINAADANQAWHSNLSLDPARLHALEAYQINPSDGAVQTELRLCAGDRIVASVPGILPGLGGRCVRFGPEQIHEADAPLHLSAQGMTGPNAKPLLFLVDKAGHFTASHS